MISINFIWQPFKSAILNLLLLQGISSLSSTGTHARLGFFVVAHLNPEILLIDEILVVGDMEFQKKCIRKMSSFKRSGGTRVFVSHSMEDVKRICDRVMWIGYHSVKMIGEAGGGYRRVFPIKSGVSLSVSLIGDLNGGDSA